MLSLWKRKPPWFTPDEIDDGDDDAYWGAENKSARTQAMRSNQRVRCTDVRWAMGKTIAENLFYTFNFPQIFLQDLFSVIEKEFCKYIIYLTCLLIWPWGRLMIWSSQRRARKPSPEITWKWFKNLPEHFYLRITWRESLEKSFWHWWSRSRIAARNSGNLLFFTRK